MLADVLAYLRCPVCHDRLAQAGPAVRCPRGHAYDVARQGYVALATRVTHQGDDAAMVAARERLLASGAYDFLDAAIVAATRGHGGLVIDAGAGTGHHLAAVLDARPGSVGLALDVSKPALRRAARAHPRAGAVLADTWRRLPVADRVADVVLNVFAPRNGAEFARVLRRDGVLVVVTPGEEHLAELTGALRPVRVDPDKERRLDAALARWFRPEERRRLRHRMRLTRDQVAALVAMGPAARHTSPAELAAALAALPEPATVTAVVDVRRYRPR
ncbi:MAG: methyltransferase domain-containing protein [Micromonosporaceae bacterium]